MALLGLIPTLLSSGSRHDLVAISDNKISLDHRLHHAGIIERIDFGQRDHAGEVLASTKQSASSPGAYSLSVSLLLPNFVVSSKVDRIF